MEEIVFNWEVGDDKSSIRNVVYRRKPLKPVFKQVLVKKPHCPKCESVLYGSNSDTDPWYCSCGTWQFISEDNYKIV